MRGADTLRTLIDRASERSRATRRVTLVSVVERIATIDPLGALENAARIAASSHEIGDLIRTRMYWTRPADAFALAGLGAAITFAPEGADRFATIDREWSALLNDAMTDDPSGGVAGAGPTLMGGFAFDPEGPRTEMWADFPAAHMFAPRLQIVLTGETCWSTTTVLVGVDGHADITPASLARLRDAFIEDPRDLTAGASKYHDVATPFAHDSMAREDVCDAAEWRVTVSQAVAAIRARRLEKVVLAREVHATAPRDFEVTTAIRQLRSAHETSYVFGCWQNDSAFVGATPERLVRVDGRDVRASSLAGSVSRGATPLEDAEHAQQLLSSAKDLAEHEIVRSALCIGLERLCDDVTAADGPALLSFPNVHHLHTAVSARLRPGHSLLQLVAQLHPTPAVGGSPRNAALRFIREHEKMDRGWYAGPVGWLQRDCGEFAVALRSALVSGPDALLFAGCGVVAGSDPDQEYAESLLKLRPMEIALNLALGDANPDTNDVTGIESAPEECGGVTR